MRYKNNPLEIKAMLVALISLALAACGGSDGPQTPINRTLTPPDYSSLKPTSIEASELKPANASSLTLHIKNGIRLQTAHSGLSHSGGSANGSPVSSTDDFALATSESADAQSYSETNTHVDGVDEADHIKYDGTHLFVSSHPRWYWGEETPEASIRIFETNPQQASLSEVGNISVVDDNWGATRELYLVNNSTTDTTSALATLRSSWSYFCWTEPTIDVVTSRPAAVNNGDGIQVSVYDVNNPSDPEKTWEVTIDGYLQESRKIGNTLYLVTQYSPYIAGLNYYPESNQQALENEELIDAAPLANLLPSVTINGGTPEALFDASDCLLPASTDEYNGHSSLTTLVALDLENHAISSAKCLNANVDGIYASQDNLYIGGSDWFDWWEQGSATVIHKFNLNDGDIRYRSTGTVPGHLSWGDASFRMSEHDDTFRIVTSWREQNGRNVHGLSILTDSNESDAMQTIATLPNSDRPDPIGKPGEDIYSVRFQGERAFIVTFERTDPLYVLDLSNPIDPKIAGELEVPGFSSYLHPINENYLLGFGKDVIEGLQQGVKVSLYDVSDSNNPQEVNSLHFGERGSDSEALYDLHAASFLHPSEDQLRFTLPIVNYSSNWNWSHSGLNLFEVNGLATNSADLTFAGEIIAEQSSPEQSWQSEYDGMRSVLHDEAVYFVYGSKIFSAFWSSPESAEGPL